MVQSIQMTTPGISDTEERFGTDRVLIALQAMLPDIARRLIASKQDMSDPAQRAFRAQPDSPAEHSPLWHQYGILTHSEQFQKIMKSDLPVLTAQWGVAQEVDAVLSEKIQGVPRLDLLQIASLLHDLGKFTTRTLRAQGGGTLLATFVGHEADSGSIVRADLRDILQKLGLHERHIEYIAQCAEHHFDLGKARKMAVDGNGYTMAYAKSDAFKKVTLDIMHANPELALEIGLMFIADSLSKTEVMAVADTDEDINAQRPALEQEIVQKGLDPRLIHQALQQPVNVEIGKRYLRLWAGLLAR